MPKFRKKPVVITAMLFTGTDESRDEIFRWVGRVMESNADGLVIETLEGKMLARPGDYVIRGVRGEFYPCKPEIFAATYEPAETPGAVCEHPRSDQMLLNTTWGQEGTDQYTIYCRNCGATKYAEKWTLPRIQSALAH